MKSTLLLVVLFAVVTVNSALPQNCRGRGCRNLRPSPNRPNQTSPQQRQAPPAPGRGRPQQGPPRRPPQAPQRPPVAPLGARPGPKPGPNRQGPARPLKNRPVTTPLPVTEQPQELEVAAVTEQKMVTDEAGNEVREVGVNGWLASPTPPPVKAEFGREKPVSKPEKPGSCDTPRGFGIKCMLRLDQCTTDHECPGSTKCCMVGECGYLCVKPKPTSTEPKEVTKESLNKNKKGDKTKVKEGLLTEASEVVEAVELPEGALKAEDIIENPKEVENIKKETAEEKPKEEEGEKEVEKVKEEVEELEEETEDVNEGAETTTQLPVEEEEEEEEEKTAASEE